MSEARGALEAAVTGGQATRARRALADLTDGVEDDRDDALDLLARHAASGSALAAELLVEAVDQQGIARRAVRRYLVDDRAVEDVVQDTLVTVAQSVGSFRGEARFTTWVHRLARNRAVDHLRRARSADPLDDDHVGPSARMSSMIVSRESVRQMLEELPPHYRDALLLRDVERLPYADVADRLGLNLNTVKSHVARGRALLAHRVVQGRDT
jgi:RNA polymerase sigma-70 factor, ECF subfamily